MLAKTAHCSFWWGFVGQSVMHPASWLANRKLTSLFGIQREPSLIHKVILSNLAVIEDGEEYLVTYIPYQMVTNRHTCTCAVRLFHVMKSDPIGTPIDSWWFSTQKILLRYIELRFASDKPDYRFCRKTVFLPTATSAQLHPRTTCLSWQTVMRDIPFSLVVPS